MHALNSISSYSFISKDAFSSNLISLPYGPSLQIPNPQTLKQHPAVSLRYRPTALYIVPKEVRGIAA